MTNIIGFSNLSDSNHQAVAKARNSIPIICPSGHEPSAIDRRLSDVESRIPVFSKAAEDVDLLRRAVQALMRSVDELRQELRAQKRFDNRNPRL